ncbi:hypothetical protein JR316_0012241 [Psilocybe cubensis]|uniref:Uncharacterized protein n=2 Tax=Psilocybe cubensis TaxID=181762 RepID=A0ACB8GJB3_PSICU|nr:hypothetical protein JR316_0012241 [Psilocybe cubensis]KAH9475130.1 hypothetical protein JR316_0012241 [Psilocybe cubensis]
MVVLSATTTIFSKDLTASPPGAIPTPVVKPDSAKPIPPTTDSLNIPSTSSTSSAPSTRDLSFQSLSTSSSDIARSTITHSFTPPAFGSSFISPGLSPPVSGSTLSTTSSLSTLSVPILQSPVSQPNGQATGIVSASQQHDSIDGTLKKALVFAGAGLGLLLILAALYRYRISYKRKRARRNEEYMLRARPFALATRVNRQVDYQPPNYATRRTRPVVGSIERLKDAFSRANSGSGPSRVTRQESANELEANPDGHFSTRRVRVVEIVDESDVYEHPPEYRLSASDPISAT